MKDDIYLFYKGFSETLDKIIVEQMKLTGFKFISKYFIADKRITKFHYKTDILNHLNRGEAAK
ncbi:MAG: hypothetical protein ACFFDN_09220 [Candidatus Hodarchaeota archaeon]